MQISNLTISSDRKQINLTIIDAVSVTSLLLWDNLTYKNYSLAIDISSKLTGTATQNIVITLADLGISYFDGVYFIEAEGTDISISAVADLTRYKECILTKVLAIAECSSCLKAFNNSIINSQILLLSLEAAVAEGFIDEIMLIIEALNKFCSDNCKSCGEYKNTLDTNYYSS
jgi:hypothetical protein